MKREFLENHQMNEWHRRLCHSLQLSEQWEAVVPKVHMFQRSRVHGLLNRNNWVNLTCSSVKTNKPREPYELVNVVAKRCNSTSMRRKQNSMHVLLPGSKMNLPFYFLKVLM